MKKYLNLTQLSILANQLSIWGHDFCNYNESDSATTYTALSAQEEINKKGTNKSFSWGCRICCRHDLLRP